MTYRLYDPGMRVLFFYPACSLLYCLKLGITALKDPKISSALHCKPLRRRFASSASRAVNSTRDGLATKIRLCLVACEPSVIVNSSSKSFSQGLIPVKIIFISFSGSRPESLIMSLAISTIFTGSPLSRTKTSPPLAIAPA